MKSTSLLPAESDGFLQLDSSNGIYGTTATGGARIHQAVRVSGEKSELLKACGAISMTAIFTLPVLSGPLNEGYGIRFIDADPGSGNNQEILALNVQWWTGDVSNPAGWYIRYFVQDFNLNTVHTIGADLVSIPSGADEIHLSISRAVDSNQFAADYAYVTGGVVGSQSSLGSAAGFLYKDFVRGEFNAFETVPEPVSESFPWLLFYPAFTKKR